MGDAFRCERCGKFEDGSGTDLRVGEYIGNKAFQSQYNFSMKMEVCDECLSEFWDTIEKWQ